VTIRRLILCLCVLVAPLWADSAFQFRFDPDTTQWQLSNGVVETAFQLTPAGTFQFQYLKGLTGQGTWNAAELRQTSLVRATVGDNVYTSRTRYSFVKQSVQSISKGYKQTIVLLTEDKNLQVTFELFLYTDQPVLRHRVTLKNLQASTAYVDLADLLPWAFADELGTFRTFRVNQWGIIPQPSNFEPLQDVLDPQGTPIEVHSGSRAEHCSWFALADQTGRGIFGGWEFDGRADISIEHLGSSNAIRISGLIADLHHPVAPDGDFVMPAGFIGLFKGDWDEAGFRTQRFTEEVLAKAPPDPAVFPYVAWDSWAYEQNIDEARLSRNAEVAAGLGFELFVVDLGWANNIGDWHENKQKFPSGLRALSDYVIRWE
jgi:Alpha-galactosidase